MTGQDRAWAYALQKAVNIHETASIISTIRTIERMHVTNELNASDDKQDPTVTKGLNCTTADIDDWLDEIYDDRWRILL